MFNERAKATYIGMTNDLTRRVLQHKLGARKSDKGMEALMEISSDRNNESRMERFGGRIE